MKERIMRFRDFDTEWTVLTATSEDPYKRARWTRDEDLVLKRVRKWRARHSWYDGRAEMFALSRAYMEHDPDKDSAWECVDLLGAGAFGMVGKWCKFDTKRRITDTVAIKQFNYEGWECDSDGRPGVPAEVALPEALDRQGCNSIAEIRTARFFDVKRPKWRIYLQYYGHGTLGDLVQRYREKSAEEGRSVHIPEDFIWQAFNDFATAYHHMHFFRLKSLGAKGRGADVANGHFVLHLDLKDTNGKPQTMWCNFLLGDAPSDEKFMPYPRLKIADWALGECTSRYDPKNSRKFRNNGTICWMPPEQYDCNRFGQNWERNVMGGTNRAYSAKHALWQMAANIYGMMELDLDNKKLEEKLREAERDEYHTRKNGYSLVPGYRHRRYSSELCQLVEDCLSIRPEDRPEPECLKSRVRKGLEPCLKRYARTGTYQKLEATKAEWGTVKLSE
ncbi:serine/threonine protein kinase [Cladophialophora yegresii CBS 114405]|uniref:non-specific serine/threonine protein kinase n=1 Tax=Cladophialophora yegresii CBS 114405 TaxID=1182544 RepID=W9WFR5_9EURO|nr:serine/threonine protein kinase [Cladophialophora yegresii CBS 114405]EXJ63830.1 serine/threonine protein kinase [Cladophialophora yegresii CBS 114405]